MLVLLVGIQDDIDGGDAIVQVTNRHEMTKASCIFIEVFLWFVCLGIQAGVWFFGFFSQRVEFFFCML